jgi:molybdate transport system ATP-binding protein
VSLEAVVAVRQGGFTLDAALSVPAGQVVAVVGPNGAGKSTLLRTLAGLLSVTTGRVTLDGRTLADSATRMHVPPFARQVGVVFQDYRLFEHLSARDNIAFGPRASGVRRRAARGQADAWLATMGLTGLADSRPAQLSGGQAQRVALARALATRPALLLLDEPLAALDAGTRAAVRADLRRHLVDFAGPSLVVTHDPLEAMTLADRLVVLEEGRVVQDGTPADVARHPRTRYVGQLVGLNVYTGTAAGGTLSTAGGAVIHLASDLTGPVTAAIRPAAVTLHASVPAGASARNTWQGTLEHLEPFGDRVRATLGGELPLLADITLGAVAELQLRPGDPVWASVKATDITAYAQPS